MLSILLARHTKGQVLATDLDDPAIFDRWERTAKTLGLSAYRSEFRDARNLKYAENTFDLVYSISVIEHIPGDGDIEALREIARVLKPNGVAVIEVPYRRKYEIIHQKYSSRGAALDVPQFYERHYDREQLQRRLIQGAEDLVAKQVFIAGEWLPLDPLIADDRLPRILRMPLLPLEPLFAAVNYWQRADDRHGRPLAALIVYTKPAMASGAPS